MSRADGTPLPEERDGSAEDAETVEELAAHLDALSTQLESLRDDLRDAEAERDALREENADLRAEVERLDARTDLLRLAEDTDDMTRKQAATALIQHLRKAAQRQRERGRGAKASVSRDEAETALHHPDVDRTTIYRYMQKAADLVGDETVLWYDSDTGGESRLRLNLEAGDLPSSVRGKQPDRGGGEEL